MARADSDPRPTWDDIWMQVADTIADRSLCSRSKVGSVIVTQDNRVASASFNGAPDSFDCQGRPCLEWCERAMTGDSSSSYDKCEALHSEANAIARADWSDIDGGTIYTTSSTCINCARLIAATGISRVVHRVSPEHAYRNPEAVEQYLREQGLDTVRVGP